MHLSRFLSLVPRVAALSLMLAPLPAEAGIFGDTLAYLGLGADQKTLASPPAALPAPAPMIAPRTRSFALGTDQLAQFQAAPLPSIAIPSLPAPSVETPLHRLFCVEYARARSGLAVFGDAKTWWARAKNLYARMSSPVENAVMVFSGSKRLKRGHVAVVTHIVSSREIRVDQANWENRGEIDHSTPVLDVSAKNDWSQVRVWDIRSGTFGAHVYPISGFIADRPILQASNN